jgi:hypothetical protein
LVCGISEKSSTEDVQKWFSSIGITVEIIQKYGGLGYLDGETIFNDLNSSLLLFRSIRILRDNPIGTPVSEANLVQSFGE